MEKFKALNINDNILKSITRMGYENPTDIQVKAIPLLLEGHDLLASAQTGTGKTAAFAIPILQMIDAKNKIEKNNEIKALILTPTRELANQIYENFILYGKFLPIKSCVIYGGVSQNKQEEALKKGCDVLIATPGRLLDLKKQEIISLEHIEYLVLDEADQMLDMGFIRDVKRIISFTPKNKQTMLFSATMPKSIEELAKEILDKPIRVSVTPVAQTLDVITQELYYVAKKQKGMLLLELINQRNMQQVLVFTKTKRGANAVAKDLLSYGMKVEPIHGNKSQAARERALANFKSLKTRVLVATDIAARGIDIQSLPYVFNYDLPDTPETYIHRIGRTGRAGMLGASISFCDKEEINLLKAIEKHIKEPIPVIENHLYQMNNDQLASMKSREKKKQSNNKIKENKDSKHKKGNNKSKNSKESTTKKYQYKKPSNKVRRHKTV